MTITEIPTVKRVKNQSSTPFRTARHVLDSDVQPRYIEFAAMYYLETNWLFSSSWGVWTPERQEIDFCQHPGTRHAEFQQACCIYRNAACVEPVELLEPVRAETYVDYKFTGTPGTPDRRYVENWISFEAYPIVGDKTNSLNRRYVDSIRKLSKRRPQWWKTELSGVFHATDASGKLIGVLAALQSQTCEKR
jgi:hypothetical protein